MAHEQTLLHPDEPPRIPPELSWQSLLPLDGDELETHYRHLLTELGKQQGMLGIIFRKAINKIQNPAHLRRLIVDLIGDIEWLKMEADVKGDAYEREAASVNRDDFWTTTSNKQLNFVQHVYILLKAGGRAAVVVPDNVLFEGGAGETIRRNLLQTCDVHTLLRLPTGIFYAQGVKANVLFFDTYEGGAGVRTQQLWVYDLRTNKNFTLRTNPLTRAHLDDFVACYRPGERHRRQESERFRVFSYEDLLKRDKLSLDLFWLRDESLEGAEKLPPPAEIAASIVEDLQEEYK